MCIYNMANSSKGFTHYLVYDAISFSILSVKALIPDCIV